MDIRTIRKAVGMTQRQFASYFGIPLGTVRNWEQGLANPPDYVLGMIDASIRRDKMINVESIKFVKMLDELATLSAGGIDSFANANEGNLNSKVFYDVSKLDEQGYYPIVQDACIADDPQCFHHDVVSYYTSKTGEYVVYAVVEEDEDPSIQVDLLISGEQIVIHDGKWYFT